SGEVTPGHGEVHLQRAQDEVPAPQLARDHRRPRLIQDLDLTPLQGQQLAAYRDTLVAARARFNLTALRDPVEIERRHLVEGVAFGRLLAEAGLLAGSNTKIIDIGSGAGLPGIPLRIAFPSLELTLLEANRKRCQFLRDVCATLGLEDVK